VSSYEETRGGLRVIWRRTGWAVEHAATGLSAATGLRQRRFAEQARDDLLATGTDFTRPAAEISRDRARWAPVYYLWKTRAGQESYDAATYEYYGSSVHAGTFVPSAGWAAAMRHATARGSYDEAEAARLLKYLNHAVNCPKKEDHRLHTVYLGENCPHCGSGDPLPGQGMPGTVADVPDPREQRAAEHARVVRALRNRADTRHRFRQRWPELARTVDTEIIAIVTGESK
jgi:hypothetical protein